MKRSNFLLLMLLIIPIVSSNGLFITGQNTFTINKTTSETKNINFTIQNQEAFTFYNLTFANNPYIVMNKINQLNSGESININASVIGIQDFNDVIKLKGFYQSNLGQNFQNFPMDVFFENGTSKCNFNVVQGDSVTWNSKINDAIVMRNSVNNEIVTTISPQSAYTINFDNPQVFSYYFTRIGLQFTSVCTITSLATSGLINNPDLDASLTLNLKINFPSTTIQATIPQINYTMSASGKVDDILNIKNTGDKTAKNIRLEGDWFSFTVNNFDLEPGQTKNVGYTIDPSGLTSTSQTNQSYFKNLSITGNFNSISQQFKIFINYSVIDASTISTTPLDDLIDVYWSLIKSYCAEDVNINSPICLELKAKIDSGQVSSENSSLSFIQFQELAKSFIEDKDERQKERNLDKIFQNDTNYKFDMLLDYMNKSVTTLNTNNDKVDNINNNQSILFATLFGFVIIIALAFVISYHKKYRVGKEASVYR